LRVLLQLYVLLVLAPRLDAARAWQDAITLPTYPEGAAETVPVLDALTPGGFYPYAARNSLGKQSSPQAWRTLNLENEYLKCTFLPDLGGHLYTCIDKRNGLQMFHGNPSIKKALIGLRGAWVSLGIEMNFPTGHSLATVSPVDFGIVQAEHSAAVWVGAVDRVTGMEWRAEFALRDGVAMLEQNVVLSNPTPVRWPYYWWNNASVEMLPDTQFILPAHLTALHSRQALETWPVSSAGVDQSRPADIPEGEGFFAYHCREPFFGAYRPDTRTATIHVADPAAVPGKKLWAWGKREDASTRTQLSDNNSQYVEIQAGLFTTQEDYAWLQPQQSRRFTEYWIPGRDLGGVSRANANGIVNLARTESGVTVQLNVTREFAGARVRIRNGAATALETVDLSPAKPFTRSLPNVATGPWRFELLDSAGAPLLEYTEGVYDADAASSAKTGPIPQPDWEHPATEQEFLDAADHEEKFRRFRSAELVYGRGLTKFPQSAALTRAAGRLAVIRKRYDEGVKLLSGAGGDAESLYYLGVAEAAVGREEDARKHWEAVPGAAALVERAASLARSGKSEDALPLLAEAKDAPRAGRMRVALLRRQRKPAEAYRELAARLADNPIDPLLRMERVLLSAPDAEMWRHFGADPERVLDVADEYINLGMYADAVPLLNHAYEKVAANRAEPGAHLPQADPLVAYYLAYCRSKLGTSIKPDFDKPQPLGLEYVYPHRASSFPVLKMALLANPSDGTAHWLLGLLYLDAGMVDEAVAEWQKAKTLRKNVPALYPLLSKTLAELKGDKAAALAVEKEGAAAVAPVKTPVPVRPPASAPAPVLRAGANPREIAHVALLQAAAGQLAGGLARFSARNFPQERQPDEIRQAYIELQLQKLRAQAAAKKCENAEHGFMRIGEEDKGLPFTMYGFDAFLKEARFQYYLGAIEAACGDERNARKRWERVARMKEDAGTPNFAFPALAAAAAGAPDADKRLQAALAAVVKAAAMEPEARGVPLYSQGLLLRALGREPEARTAFEAGAKALDRNHSEYLNLLALHEIR
jgi:tetratricopeptide (TPR) repeat protein